MMAGYVSQLSPNEPVYDDSNLPPHEIVIDGDPKSRGFVPRDWNKHPFGSMPFAEELDLPLIPRSEWDDRIAEMERTKTRLSDLCDVAGLPCLDQDGTNYCWINAPTYCVEVVRVVQNQPTVLLSPASVGAKIKNFRNSGGWGAEGLEYIVQHGLVPVDKWPANAISRQYDTSEADAEREKYRCQEWYDLKPRSFDQLITCLLLRIPVAVGYNWWSHEVSAIDPVALGNGKYGVRIRNSWGMSYGDRGYAVLNESKGTPDDAVAPRVVTPS